MYIFSGNCLCGKVTYECYVKPKLYLIVIVKIVVVPRALFEQTFLFQKNEVKILVISLLIPINLIAEVL